MLVPTRARARHVAALLLLALAAPAAEAVADAAERGRAIFEEADRRASGFGDAEVALTMILRGPGGDQHARELTIRQLEMPDDGDRYLIVFETPKSIKGTALLSWSHTDAPDEQWLFLPSLRRVKKISARNRSGPFLSSEFSFEDLAAQELDKYHYRFVGETDLDGVPCHVVDRMPLDEWSGYSRQRAWLDREHYRVLRIEFFSRRDDLLKTLTLDDYRLYDGRFWKAQRMLMQNHRTGRSTELRWGEFAFGNGLLAERDFSANSLRRSR